MKTVFASAVVCGLLLGLGLIKISAQDKQTEKISQGKSIPASPEQAANPFLGTWKLNIEKSIIAPSPKGQVQKEHIMVVKALNSGEFECAGTIVLTDGSSTSTKYTFPPQGGVRKFEQDGPPASMSIIDTFWDKNEAYTAMLVNGRQMRVTRWIISADGKTMRGITKSASANRPLEETLWEKQ